MNTNPLQPYIQTLSSPESTNYVPANYTDYGNRLFDQSIKALQPSLNNLQSNYDIPNPNDYALPTDPEQFNKTIEAYLQSQGLASNQAADNSPNSGGMSIADRVAAIEQLRAENPPQSSMTQPSLNLGKNLLNNAREIGTGLTYLGTHIPELLTESVQNIQDYYKGTENPVDFIMRTGKAVNKAPGAIVNAIGSTYNFNLNELGGRTGQDILLGAIAGAYQRPLDATLDFLGLGGGKLIKGAVKNIPGLKGVVKGADVEKAITGEAVGVTQDVNKLERRLQTINKLDTDSGIKNKALLREAIEGAETGATVSKEAKPILKELKAFAQEYDDLAKKYSPATWKGMEDTAVTQKILRDELKVNPQVTFSDVEKQVVALKNSGVPLADLAKDGNQMAQRVIDAQKLYNEGRIFPVTHAMTDAQHNISTVAAYAGDIEDAAIKAGQFSNRILGTSTYEDIAKSLSSPDRFLEDLSRSYVKKSIAQAILRGDLSGLNFLEEAGKAKSKDVRYLSRDLLKKGELERAIESANDPKTKGKRVHSDDIPMEASTLWALGEQVASDKGLGKYANEAYKIAKSNMLASGGYLGANFTTGAMNAILNSGPMVINDLIDSIRSQGRLSKELGVYRRSGKPRFEQGFIGGIQKFNRYTGGAIFTHADKLMQNKFAEMAANAELRKRGIPFNKRVEAIRNMNRQELGQIVTDLKRTALINSTYKMVPNWATELAGVTQPFWRWSITATQSTYRMFEKSPFLANVVLTDMLANIGFDKEMQNRVGLGVTLDKPYVSFKIDPKSGNMRTMSAEFLPLTTTIRAFDNSESNFSPTVVGVGKLLNAAQGKDQYGNYMKRALKPGGTITQVIGDKRYEYNPATGEMKQIGGTKGEIINATLSSVFGLPTAINKTVAPLLAPFLSSTGQYYQPYGESLFGTFEPNDANANILQGGNPLRGRSAEDVIRTFKGQYETPYFEREDMPISGAIQRRFFRSYGRDMGRRAIAPYQP